MSSSSGGWDHPSPFIVEHRVADSEIDRLNHANNVAYLAWLEAAAWAHSESLGLDWAAYQRLGVACVVRNHELEYLAAAYAGDELEVATWIESNDGRLSLWRRFQVRRKADGVTLLRARSRFVCMRLADGRACRMPDEFKTGYAPTPE